MTRSDAVRAETVVRVPPDEAFAVFTDDVDAWWRRGPAYRFGGGREGTLRFEPGVGGRLVEAFDDGGEHEVGRIVAWEPGARLAFEFRPPNFAPDERTVVDVRFEPHGAAATRVLLEHRGWTGLPPRHPARHGLPDRDFLAQRGSWWIDQLRALRRRSD